MAFGVIHQFPGGPSRATRRLLPPFTLLRASCPTVRSSTRPARQRAAGRSSRSTSPRRVGSGSVTVSCFPGCRQGSMAAFPLHPKRQRSTSTPCCPDWRSSTMLKDNKVSAVLVSTDLERAQRFYEDKVGLKLSAETIKNHLVFECGAQHRYSSMNARAATRRTTPKSASGRPTSIRTWQNSSPTASSSRSTTLRRSRPSTTS